MSKAAGILFVCSTTGNVLFLRRSAASHHPGLWDFPGGHAEGDETFEEAARREAREEIGALPDDCELSYLTRSTAPQPGEVPQGVATAAAPPMVNGGPAQQAALPPPNPGPLESIDYTTFLCQTGNEFIPDLNDEHEGFAWAPVGSPPEPLHPGCRVALERLSMNELGVARAIADGRLVSPQRYENLWLFAIRITGTGVAYRNSLDEFVHRSPENYLNDEFLARCNGLPVIYVDREAKEKGFHPSSALLDPDQFKRRIVGSIFLPYIAGDEVWGVAKIHDDAAAQAMVERQLSTSPSVFFRKAEVNAKLRLEDGATLLIEGDPSLLDHVAICEEGVWDKGGDPAGVRSESREDEAMPEEVKKEHEEVERKVASDAEDKEKAKDDAAKKADAGNAGEVPDKELSNVHLDAIKGIGTKLDAMHKRMDEFETKEKEREDARKARKDAKRAMKDAARRKDEEDKRKAGDPEQLAADKAKKDAEEKEREEKEKADTKAKDDAARADSQAVKDRIEQVAKMVTPLPDDDHHALAEAWTRADAVFSALGKPTPRAMPGETASMYRRRTAKLLKEFSPTWKAVDLSSQAFADDAAFGVAESQILSEAATFARSPATVPAGQLRMVSRTVGGHVYNDWVGEPRAWMNPMAGPVQLKAQGVWTHQQPGHRL